MGRQVAIIAAPEDIRELLSAAAALGACAVPERIPLDDPPELYAPEALFGQAPDSTLYLLPGELPAVEVMPIEPMDQPGTATVNERTSPVVELIPPLRAEGALRAGRLYLGLEPSHRLYPPAKRLFDALVSVSDGWSRTEQHDIRVGPAAAAAAKDEGQRLASVTGERATLREP